MKFTNSFNTFKIVSTVYYWRFILDKYYTELDDDENEVKRPDIFILNMIATAPVLAYHCGH